MSWLAVGGFAVAMASGIFLGIHAILKAQKAVERGYEEAAWWRNQLSSAEYAHRAGFALATLEKGRHGA